MSFDYQLTVSWGKDFTSWVKQYKCPFATWVLLHMHRTSQVPILCNRYEFDYFSIHFVRDIRCLAKRQEDPDPIQQ